MPAYRLVGYEAGALSQHGPRVLPRELIGGPLSRSHTPPLIYTTSDFSDQGREEMERAYTVRELDALRSAVERKWLFGSYRQQQVSGGFSRSYHEAEKAAAVEQMVRTHMLAGHTADDLYASEEPPNA